MNNPDCPVRPLPFAILYEDNYILVVDKPSGLQVEKDRWGNSSLETYLADYFEEKYPWKKQWSVGVVHRLDRLVSGVIVFAKTRQSLKELNRQFAERKVGKYYRALVEGELPQEQGMLVHWLKKDDENRKAIVRQPKDKTAKESTLEYHKRSSGMGTTLLEVKLLTGRYHQIRAQLAAVGNPILGDEKYGSTTQIPPGGICLQSHRLVIAHPKTGAQMEFAAPVPAFWKIYLPEDI